MRKLSKIKNLVAAFTVVLGLGAFTGCGDVKKGETVATTENEVENTELKVVRIGAGDATGLQLIDLAKIAQNKGYLEEELNAIGYKYEVFGFQGQGPEINSALMSGSIDVGIYGDFPALTSKANGADTTIISIANPQYTYGVFAGPEEIKTPKDLEGKKVVVQQGTTLYYFWEQYAKANDIDLSKVQVINSNVVDATSLIQTKDADAFISAYSSLKYYEATGLGHVIESNDISADGYTATVVNIDNKYLENNKEVAVAINKALIRASEDAQSNPDDVYAILGNTYGDAGAEFAKAAYGFDSKLSYFKPEITPEIKAYFKETVNWMKENKIIDTDIDVDTYLDSSYYEQAKKELGK